MHENRPEQELGIYRKVYIRMWGDERVRRLTVPQPNGRDCFQYLLVARESISIPGVIPAGPGALSDSLKWSREGFLKAFQEVVKEGLAEADWDAPLVWMPKAIRYNAPTSPNVVKSWKKFRERIPECALKDRILRELEGFLKALGKPFLKAFEDGFGEGMPKPGSREQGAVSRDSSLPPTSFPEPEVSAAPAEEEGKDPDPFSVDGFWAYVQDRRAARGLPAEGPRPQSFSAWYLAAYAEAGDGVFTAYNRYLRDETFEQNGWPIRVFITDGVWRIRVPSRQVPEVRL